MSLMIQPLKNKRRNRIFPHSRIFKEGAGDIRPGMATIVVALDGSGDCDTLQEAIDRIAGDGGTIYIKEGIYEINEAMSISLTNLQIYGSGAATILKFNTSGNDSISINSADEVIIADLYLKQTAGNDIIEMDTNNFVVFKNVTIDNAGRYGIRLNNSGDGLQILNCIFKNCTNDCIYGEDPTLAMIHGCIFMDSDASGIAGSAIQLSTITGCIFDNLGGDGIELAESGCDYNTITGNIFHTITGNAVAIDNAGATKNIVTSNSMIGNSVSDSGTGTIIANNAT